MLALAGIPVWMALCHAALLMSVNRYMVPVYPLSLSCGVVVAARLWRRAGERLVARLEAGRGEPEIKAAGLLP